MFFGHLQGLKHGLSHKVFRPLAKLNYIAYLIYPALILMIYSSQEEAIFLRYPYVLLLLTGHIVCAYIFSFVVYMFIEGPLWHVRERVATRIKFEARRLRAQMEYNQLQEAKH